MAERAKLKADKKQLKEDRQAKAVKEAKFDRKNVKFDGKRRGGEAK